MQKPKTTPGEALRTLREANGLTQAELAERVGMPHPTISMLETGAKVLGQVSAERLAPALGTHAAALLYPDFVAQFQKDLEKHLEKERALRRRRKRK